MAAGGSLTIATILVNTIVLCAQAPYCTGHGMYGPRLPSTRQPGPPAPSTLVSLFRPP